MPIVRWNCSHGDAPTVTLDVEGPPAPINISIAPLDDRIDSNLVRIQGRAIINGFGEAAWITKRVILAPGLTLKHNPPQLVLLGGTDREITTLVIGTYSCDGEGNWTEVQFTETGAREVTQRLESIEQRLTRIESHLKVLKIKT